MNPPDSPDEQIADILAATPVTSLDLGRYVTVAPDASVADTVAAMNADQRSCACVVGDAGIEGIFTQRDVLTHVLGRPRSWDRSVAEEMTHHVRTIADTDSISDGLAVMTDWWVRNVPVCSDDRLVGNLSYWTVMKTMMGLLTSRLEPALSDGTLSFVDFTGLNRHAPVTAHADDSVEVAVHHMRNRGIGFMLVVDDRHHLCGTLSEFDLQTKIGCDVEDISTVTVAQVMDARPNTLGVRSTLAEAIETLTVHEDSHVALLGETERPVGVASFRDIAAYLEMSLDAAR